MKGTNPYHSKKELSKERKAERFWQWFDKAKSAFLFIAQVEPEEVDRLVNMIKTFTLKWVDTPMPIKWI